MKLFKRSQKKDDGEQLLSAGRRLSKSLDKWQRQLADFLSRQSEKLSPKGKKLLLLLFGILMGGISIWLIVKPFQDSRPETFLIPQAIQVPEIQRPESHSYPLISKEDYQVLHGLKQTLDSLKVNDRPTYDELLNGRQGLLDSINFLLNLYH